MSTLIVIPSYWTKVTPMEAQSVNQRSFDQQFGHTGSSLEKALTSLNILKEKDFQVLVVTGTDSPENQEQINQMVAAIMEKVADKTRIKILLFHGTIVARMQEIFRDFCDQDALDFLYVDGYANIRNTGLIVAQILGAEEVIFVDDDEYIDDPLFLHKAREHLGKTIEGKIVAGVGGYYVDPQKAYPRTIKPEPWKTFWDLERLLNQALCHLVETQPRIKLTPWHLADALYSHAPFLLLFLLMSIFHVAKTLIMSSMRGCSGSLSFLTINCISCTIPLHQSVPCGRGSGRIYTASSTKGLSSASKPSWRTWITSLSRN